MFICNIWNNNYVYYINKKEIIMNYIYDVITNFNDTYYDFYEWNKKDKLTHFKKIPIINI